MYFLFAIPATALLSIFFISARDHFFKGNGR